MASAGARASVTSQLPHDRALSRNSNFADDPIYGGTVFQLRVYFQPLDISGITDKI
ncbi:MAG: hypothetical protein J7641_05615 [Cyanobacteria bacterium SID2]|nr:hypothetical protein [Cyanobacteria bacterium SID2]MBP0002620.1 hypothetical protein [Cyanobacteria bacterium SBC]